jgi:F-type H+-transporting ATPase subunit b
MGLVMPNPGTIFWMLIIFGIVLFVLRKFAWKPILNALSEREESIATALNTAEAARKEVEGLKANNEKFITEARKEKDIILKGQKSIDHARQQIQAEKTAAISEIKKQVAELSVLIAEKVIKKELSNLGEQEKMVNGLIDDIKLN